MEKHFFRTTLAQVSALALVLIISIIVYSCHKEGKLTQQEINAAKAAENFSVKEASTWFGESKSTLANKIKLTADVDFLKDLSDFKPIWDSARTAVDTNYYVVEAPARYAKRWAFNTDSTTANINGRTRLLVLRSKTNGSTTAVLMHVHGNPGVNATNVHYMDVPQTFSGNIFYTSLQGAGINGYIYKNGKIVLVSSGKSSTTKPSGPQILDLAPGECETVTTYWYEQTCYYTNNDELIGCGGWQYTHTTIDTYCAPIGGNTGGGGGVTPSNCTTNTGSGGGGTTPPNDPPPGGGIITINKVGSRLILKINDNNGDTPCAVAVIKNNVKDSCLRKMVDSAINRNVEYNINASMNSIFGTSTQFNLTFTDGPLDPKYDGQTTVPTNPTIAINKLTGRDYIYKMDVNIELNSTTLPNASREYITVSILHEVLHAYFDVTGQLLDHDVMVNQYIPWFKSAMHTIYPGISDPDLTGLAYGGLMDNQAFINSSEYGMKNIYNNVNNAYSSGILGHKCQ